jgi:glycosyltransferase involved in cell wall biosynthesis
VVYISHSELGYQLLPYLQAHCPEVTFVDYDHIEQEDWKNGGYPRMSVEYQESLDLSMVTSEHLKRWMIEQGAEPDRIEVCYINVDPAEWHPDPEQRAVVRTELELDDDTPLIFFAGRICPQKQPRVLAHTLLRLSQQKTNFVALIAGDGPEMGWLRDFINEHNLTGQVRLLRDVSNQRVRALMTAVDIFFLPSQWEGIALSIYEAMASGLSVVGADVGGQRELVTPECGELITRSDEKSESESYATILAELVADPQRCHKMGQAGRERVSTHFRLEQMGEKMVALLEQAKRLHIDRSRPIPSVGLGQVCATQAVEYTRISLLAKQLWDERNSNIPQNSEHNEIDWRERLYLTLYRWHEPIYHWYTQRGWNWLTPVRERITRVLLHHSTG